MSLSRRSFLRTATAAGTVLGGSLLFSNRSAATAQPAVGQPESLPGRTAFGDVATHDAPMTLHSTGAATHAPAPLPSGGRFVSVDFGDADQHAQAMLRYTLSDGQVADVHVSPSHHGPDFVESRMVSDPLFVPAEATTVELIDAPGQAKVHVHAFAPQPEEEVALMRAGVTPQAADRNNNATQLSAEALGLSSKLTDLLGQPGVLPGSPETDGNHVAVIDGLTVVSRAGWGANESLRTWSPSFYRPQLITVHHSATSTAGYTDYSALVRGIYSFHASPANGGRGWGDIGYHLLIDPNGVVYQGRSTGSKSSAVFQAGSVGSSPRLATAAHVYNANNGNIGICLLGNFGSSRPTTAALNSLSRVVGHLCRGLQLDPRGQVQYSNGSISRRKSTITGHRDWGDVAGATTCPGNTAYSLLPQIRRQA